MDDRRQNLTTLTRCMPGDIVVLCRSDHIKLCLSMGRGRLSVKRHPLDEAEGTIHMKNALIDKSNRNEVFESIVQQFGSITEHHHPPRARTTSSSHKKMWPLGLPTSVNAMLLCHMAETTIALEYDANCSIVSESDSFVVASFLARLETTVAGYKSVLRKSNHGNDFESLGCPQVQLTEARLLVLALLRCNREVIVDTTCKCIDLLVDFMGICTTWGIFKNNGVTKDDFALCELSGFIARFLVVTSTLVDLVQATRRDFQSSVEALCHVIRKTHYHPPEPEDQHARQRQVHSSDPHQTITDDDGQDEDDCFWYTREHSFMGLFGDWECPFIPVRRYHAPTSTSVDEDLPDAHTLPERTKKRCSRLLEQCLRLGFDVAPCDNCYLIYSAWNAAVRIRPLLITPDEWWKASMSKQIKPKDTLNEMSARALLLIRDRTLTVHCALHPETWNKFSSSSKWQSMLCKTFSRLRRRAVGNELEDAPEILQNSVSDAVQLLASLQESALFKGKQENDNERLSPVVFSALTSAIVHLEFLTSEHTTPTYDCIQAMMEEDASSAVSDGGGERHASSNRAGVATRVSKKRRKDSSASADRALGRLPRHGAFDMDDFHDNAGDEFDDHSDGGKAIELTSSFQNIEISSKVSSLQINCNSIPFQQTTMPIMQKKMKRILKLWLAYTNAACLFWAPPLSIQIG
jgi:hypothetical protein